jgi:cell division protein FtsQ
VSTVSIGLPGYGHDSRYLRPETKRPLPRRRVRRAWRKFALAGVLVLVLPLAAREGVRRLMASRVFELKNVVVEGCERSAPEQVRALVMKVSARNLFKLDLAEARALAESHPWVRHAEIRRRLPETIALTVTERIPAAVALIRGRAMLVDEEGVPLAECGTASDGCDAPVLTGLGEADEADGGRIAEGVAALKTVARLAPGLAMRTSELDLSRADRLTLLPGDGGTPLYLSPEDHGRNLENFLSIEKDIGQRFARPEYVDLRFRGRIAVMPSAHPAQADGAGTGR